VQRLEVDARDLDVEILRFEAEQPVAHATADQPRPADAPHGLEHRAQIGGELERKGHSSFFAKAATTTQIQPAMSAIPPSGVTGPSQRGPPSASP